MAHTFRNLRWVQIICTFVLLLTAAVPAFAVSEAGVLFLLISPSPRANAMGQTYGATVSASPMASFFNPASLGFFAGDNYFGTAWYSDKTAWLPAIADGMTFDAKSTCFGVNLEPLLNIPVSVGAAFNSVTLDYGEMTYTGETGATLGSVSARDRMTGTAFSIAVDYYVRASIGYTFKSLDTQLPYYGAGMEHGATDAQCRCHDIGFIAELPVFPLLYKLGVMETYTFYSIEPFFNPGFYYSKTNIGSKIEYADAFQSDLLPRNLSAGINFSAGFAYAGRYNTFNIIALSWAREADDLLIGHSAEYTPEYVSGCNDLDFFNSVLFGKANDKAVTKKGYEFSLGDFYFVREGRYEDIEGSVMMKTRGYGINFTQPLKIAAELLHIQNKLLMRILTSINIEKHHAEYKTEYGHPLYGTEFTSYVVRVNNFPVGPIL